MASTEEITNFIKQSAMRSGFTAIGIAKAEYMDAEARKLEEWLQQDNHGRMRWMENHFDLRVDPNRLVPGSKSVISFLYNYHVPEEMLPQESFHIASYALGKDYHKILKKKLKQLLFEWQEMIGEFSARCFVDSAPVLERDWAKRSGLGWIGKNTLLLSPQKGSYFFLAEIICDLELIYDHPIQDHCGTCTQCIDACPTDAIHDNGYWLDASRCISYLTIELREEKIPEDFRGKMEEWIFGCDICQQVCPWNRFSTPHKDPKLAPNPELLEMSKRDWLEITEEVFERIAFGSAIKRTKYEGLKRNIEFVSGADVD